MKDINDEDYSRPLEVFSGSTLGQHTRHFVEFFQCLLEQSALGVVNYDKRKRNQLIQENQKVAFAAMDAISTELCDRSEDEALKLETNYGLSSLSVSTTFERELVFNIEHTVHHLALLRIGLIHLNPNLQLDPGFGVASSTQRHKEEICAR